MPIRVPELTKKLADEITAIANTQYKQSKDFKVARLKQIQESENLYFGIVEKSLRNPFNDCFPFMSGFIDTLHSKIDDPPKISFRQQELADLKKARKVTSAYNSQRDSTLPHARWALKDRWCKKYAEFSGVGVYKTYGEVVNGEFRFNLEVPDYYDFHCEPGGGGHLEYHLYCGQEGIFKTKEELEAGAEDGFYDAEQVGLVISKTSPQDYKENSDEQGQRLNRQQALQQDAETNNYVGQEQVKLVEWYLTYKGVRWYCLFDPRTMQWIRVKPLREIFSIPKGCADALWPFVMWQTHEDGRLAWSKAPADDARSIAKNINRLINQELYNREKNNAGQRGYDPEMIEDLEALSDWRPDGLVPVNTKGGTRQISEGIFEFKSPELNGTINLVTFLDAYSGQKMGSTPGSQGAAPADQKVGIFFGEMEQIEDRIGTNNKSYSEAWAEIGRRFIIALKDKLESTEVAVSLMGSMGIEYETLTSADLESMREFDVIVEGGSSQKMEAEARDAKKLEGLKSVQTVNPRWKDKEILKITGYSDEDLKEAFSEALPGTQELLAEAAEAMQLIELGGTPKLNRGATVAFMEFIKQYADDFTLKDPEKELMISQKMYAYCDAHAIIVAQNMSRMVEDQVQKEMMAITPELMMGMKPEKPVTPGGGGAPVQNEKPVMPVTTGAMR